MKILFDIGHPAHVHQFKNTIIELKKRGHEIKITARDKEVTLELLQKLGLDYTVVGTYQTNTIKKIMMVPVIDLALYNLARKFNPDIMIGGVGNVYIAHASFFLNKKSILFNDTEHAFLQNILSFPFVSSVVTPECYENDVGKKQIRYNGYHELAYLHPHYFTPDSNVLQEMGFTNNDKFVIMRFVSWGASHDIGHSGLTLELKRRAIKEFEKNARVFITSEKPLTSDLEKYRITVSPEKMHNLLYYATLLYGESATMASECAVLGTHAVFCDFAGRGYTNDEERAYNLVYNFKLDEGSLIKSIEKASELLKDPNLKEKGLKKRVKLLADHIDVTKFMVWFIENYPKSTIELKQNPNLLKNFK
jgi:predicted glycosyltransferase